jgi:hypothetical protein
MRRSTFLKNTLAAALAAALPAGAATGTATATAAGAIDRRALVLRHNPTLTRLDPKLIAQVGNGEIAFGLDATGAQTFHGLTMSHWGWHNVPPPCPNPHDAFRLTPNKFYGRTLPYRNWAQGNDPLQKQLFAWLRENPHRFNLGRLRYVITLRNGKTATAGDFKNLRQTLDLWTGVVTSEYTIEDVPVRSRSCCDPVTGALATILETPLLAEGRLKLEWSFPYGNHGGQGGVWNAPEKHKTKFARSAQEAIAPNNNTAGTPAHSSVMAMRDMDDVSFGAYLELDAFCALADGSAADNAATGATGNAAGTTAIAAGTTAPTPHFFTITPAQPPRSPLPASRSPSAAPALRFTLFYDFPTNTPADSGKPRVLPAGADAAFAASAAHWKKFWSTGGAVDLSGSTDPRWRELERRIVLSQYLLAVQEAGSLPPQESGLYNNGWNGKFHLEMHFWHGAHYALWNRFPLLDRSLTFYRDALPAARKLAATQGFKGARYPKMVGPNAEDSPSGTGPFLIWQQPHPIFYAELEYRLRPTHHTLEKWREIIHETATFMADFPQLNPDTGNYDLGPPLSTVPENTNYQKTKNPTFELCYWRVGLRLAQTWRERLGQPRLPAWDNLIARLAPLPTADGTYLQQDAMLDTYTKMNWEHPGLIGPNGVLPADGTDPRLTRRTVEKVWKTWKWDRVWGWDFPMFAMAAAKNGRPDLAVDALLHPSPKNSMNTLGLSSAPFPYFPSNGGLLYAIALMCAGWDGCPKTHAPGFPADGSWRVRWENLSPAP